jgi:uncharacterized protein YoxC
MDDQELQTMKSDLAEIKKSESFWHKYALQIAIIVFMAGGGWITLANVQALAEDNKTEIEKEQERAQEIEKKLVRIETKQEQIAEDVDEVQEKLDAILEAVRRKED